MKCPACFGTGLVQDWALVGMLLKSRRTRSLRDVARAMGLSAAHLCRLERGKRRWTKDLVKAYKAHCR